MHHLTCKHYPFAAIVGQERLKTALLLNAINPLVGGVLIRGAKGTAKSTAVRALAEVLPSIEVIGGCPYHCHPTETRLMCDTCQQMFEKGEMPPSRMLPVPFITLPLSATEDRVAGTIDVAGALKTGTAELKPGLLAEANRGVLYLDEVNLLDDHLVNILLDAAAMGRNVVEREGISAVHPARFILIGTMNPEEGELRPQLLDRFGICVEVETLSDLDDRVEIMSRLDRYEKDPPGLLDRFAHEQHDLTHRIEDAIERLPSIEIDRDMMRMAAGIALEADVEGHRADLSMTRVAATLAAWLGHERVTEKHLEEAAGFVLSHRLRKKPFDRQAPPPRQHAQTPPEGDTKNRPQNDPEPESPGPVPQCEAVLPESRSRGSNTGAGARGVTGPKGKKLGSKPRTTPDEPVDVAATLLSAATRNGTAHDGPVPDITPDDFKSAKVSHTARRFVCFLVDTSGSMQARQRLAAVHAASRRLLEQSYQGRHQVALVTAGGAEAAVAVPATRAVEALDRVIEQTEPGGKTPLAHGLVLAGRELDRATKKGLAPALVVLTDGRANQPLSGGDPLADTLDACEQVADLGVDSLVVDTENDFINLGLGRDIADRLGADYLRVESPEAENILSWMRKNTSNDSCS